MLLFFPPPPFSPSISSLDVIYGVSGTCSSPRPEAPSTPPLPTLCAWFLNPIGPLIRAFAFEFSSASPVALYHPRTCNPHDLLPNPELSRPRHPSCGRSDLYPRSDAYGTMHDDEPSLNIPSLLTLAVVSFFVIRWFFNRDDSPAGGGRPRGRGNAVDPASVEQVSQMFPQLSTRDIMWDLQRNGGSVAATTERILTGRGLETVCIAMPRCHHTLGLTAMAVPPWYRHLLTDELF